MSFLSDIVLYLFNPFPDYVLREVLTTWWPRRSVIPRSIFVLYNAPFEKQEFERIPELRQYYETSQYQLYRVRIPITVISCKMCGYQLLRSSSVTDFEPVCPGHCVVFASQGIVT